MTKDELQLFIVTEFKKHYKNFPTGELTVGDRPDIIVAGDRKVGIEIAEVFQDLDKNKASYLKELENKHNKAGAILLSYIKKYTDRNFIFDIEFSSRYDFKVNQISDLMKQCLPSCLEFILNSTQGTIRLNNNYVNHPFPKEINSIYIQMMNNETVYSNGQGGTVCNLKYEHISGILSKHEKSLINYEKCDDYWLLIREGNYYAGSFNEIDIQVPIKSNFDKVFILRTRINEVVVLK